MISPTALRKQLNRIFADQPTVFKINLSFGFILRNTETAALQYHHPSANNNLVLEQPFLISDQADLDCLYEQVNNIDFLQWIRQQRPNSKWVVDLVTNVHGLFGKSAIIPSAVANIYQVISWATWESLHWIVTFKEASLMKIICVYSAVWLNIMAVSWSQVV